MTCEHDWVKLARVLCWPLNAKKEFPWYSSKGTFDILEEREHHYILNDIYIVQCKKCGEVKLIWDPWNKILGEKDE